MEGIKEEDIILTGTKGVISVFDIRLGKLIKQETVHRGFIRDILKLPNNVLSTCSEDKTIKFYKLPSLKAIRTIKCESEVWTMTYLRGAYLASGDFSNHVIIHNYETGKEKNRIDMGFPVVRVISHLRRRLIVSLKNTGNIFICDWKSGQQVATLKGHEQTVNNIILHPNNRTLISCSDDRTVRVYDLQNLECVRTLDSHYDGVFALTFCEKETKFLSSSYDRGVILWDLKHDKYLERYDFHRSWVVCLESIGEVLNLVHNDDVEDIDSPLTPYNHYFASGGNDKMLCVWEMGKSEKPVYQYKLKTPVKSLCYLGKTVLSRVQEFGSSQEKERFEFMRNEIFQNIRSLSLERQMCLVELDEDDRNKDLYLFKSMVEKRSQRLCLHKGECDRSGNLLDEQTFDPRLELGKEGKQSKLERMFFGGASRGDEDMEVSLLHVFFGNFEPREYQYNKIIKLFSKIKEMDLKYFILGFVLKMEIIEENHLEELLRKCVDQYEEFDFENKVFRTWDGKPNSVLTLTILNELKRRKSEFIDPQILALVGSHNNYSIFKHPDLHNLVSSFTEENKKLCRKIRIYDNLIDFNNELNKYQSFKMIFREKCRYLYRTKWRTNLVVTCEGEEFKVHKEILLYRSNFFYQMIRFDLLRRYKEVENYHDVSRNLEIFLEKNEEDSEESENEEEGEEEDMEVSYEQKDDGGVVFQTVDVQVMDEVTLGEYIKFIYFVHFDNSDPPSVESCFRLLAHCEMFFEDEFYDRTMLIIDRIIKIKPKGFFSRELMYYGHLLNNLPEEKRRAALKRWSNVTEESIEDVFKAIYGLHLDVIKKKSDEIEDLKKEIATMKRRERKMKKKRGNRGSGNSEDN